MVRRRSAAAPPRARIRSPAHPGRDQGASKAHGPVAQLVEQRVYTAAVVGSSPAGSTTGLLDGSLCLVRLSRFGESCCAPRARRAPRPADSPGRVRRLFPARERGDLGVSRPEEVENAAGTRHAVCLSPAPGGVEFVMSPQLTSCQVGWRESSAGGFRHAELARREVGWIVLRWARIMQAGPVRTGPGPRRPRCGADGAHPTPAPPARPTRTSAPTSGRVARARRRGR